MAGVPDGVQLQKDGLYLNFDPGATLGNLSFSSSVSGLGMQTGANSFKADGDGYYDILIGTSSGGWFTHPSSSISFTITSSSDSITPSSFGFLSDPGSGGNTGPFPSAVHIGGYNQNGGSAWVSPVPETKTIVAGALALLPFGASTLRIVRKNRTA
jgi:hypothetical protein